jgi:uncharacterized protein YxjI
MILKVQQTKHDLKNAYQITSGGKLLYSACASNLHKLGDLTIYDKNGQCLCTLSRTVKMQELLIPDLLTVFPIEKTKDFYQLEGALSGTFYHRIKGLSVSEYHIQTDISSLVIHPLYHGSRELFLVFTADEEQIALIERHTTVVNQKDAYTLYLTERYEHTALLLSAWILLYDHQNYGDQREVSAGISKTWSWSMPGAKGRKLYNPKWGQDEFQEQAPKPLFSNNSDT